MPHIGLAPHRDHEYVGMLGGVISHHACPANPLPAAARADHAPGVCGHPPGPAARPPVLITLRSCAQRPAGKSDASPAGTWRMVRPKTAYSKTPTSTRWIVGKRISGQTGEVPVTARSRTGHASIVGSAPGRRSLMESQFPPGWRIADVRARHEAELMRYPNVVGVADGIA